MKTYSDREASQNLAELLGFAEKEAVEIRCNDGRVFRVVPAVSDTRRSPLDVPGAVDVGRVKQGVTVEAVRASRERN
jgi:hypothetical protein